MKTPSTDRVRKEITLNAPLARVWRALADFTEFGAWFAMRLEGPIELGGQMRGPLTHPGCEHLTFKAQVERMDAEECLAFRWQPQAIDPDVDYSGQPTTLVEFRLKQLDGGTLLTVTESGFDALPKDGRAEAFLRNESGWAGQVLNIKEHVDG